MGCVTELVIKKELKKGWGRKRDLKKVYMMDAGKCWVLGKELAPP